MGLVLELGLVLNCLGLRWGLVLDLGKEKDLDWGSVREKDLGMVVQKALPDQFLVVVVVLLQPGHFFQTG